MPATLNIEQSKLLSLLNFDKNIQRAEGAYLYTSDGEQVLDFTSQYGAVPFGHNPEFLWRVLIEQSQLSPAVMIQPLQTSAAVRLSEELVKLLANDLRHVVLASTGAETVEIAIKMARASTSRLGVLSAQNSFHGKTMAALLATGNEYYREPFHYHSDHFNYVDYDDLAALERALKGEDYAAFIVEPIQGEGGMVVPAAGYLKGCELLCKKYGTLFVIDEIQVGLGRTGSLFVCQKQAVEPDILLLAKALGGGLMPIGACLANNKAWSKDFGQRHSSTFANNHLSSTIALALIEKIRDDASILENVNEVGAYLSLRLGELVELYPQAYESASGYGFMQGITLTEWNDQDAYMSRAVFEQGFAVPLVSSYLLNKHGLFTAPTLNSQRVIRIQPNLLMSKKQIDELIHGLDRVGQLISTGRYAELFRNVIGLDPLNCPIRIAKAGAAQLCETDTILKSTGKKLGTFAFLMHATSDHDILANMPGGADAYSDNEQIRVLQWIERLKEYNDRPTAAFYVSRFYSKQGDYVDGWLVTTLLTPREMLRLSKRDKTELLNSYIKVAQSKGATVVGLGAYTSVISRSGTRLPNCSAPVTTGNAYTALVSTDSLRKVCDHSQRKLSKLHLGVVGVCGSVGRLALLDLAPECQRVSLIGNISNRGNLAKLEILAGELLVEIFAQFSKFKPSAMFLDLYENGVHIPQQSDETKRTREDYLRSVYNHAKRTYELNRKSSKKFPIVLSNDIEAHLPYCDLVITATSNGEAFILPEMLCENAIVCDVARPSDLTREVTEQRKDVLVYEGGLVIMPEHIRFGRPNIVGLADGVTLACLSETIILAMEQISHNFSIGGTSSLQEARQVFQWGSKHGFSTLIPAYSNAVKENIDNLRTDFSC